MEGRAQIAMRIYRHKMKHHKPQRGSYNIIDLYGDILIFKAIDEDDIFEETEKTLLGLHDSIGVRIN